MSPRDWTLRVRDMLLAISRIEQYTTDMTFEAFRTDQKTIDAVILNLQLLGEAASHVPESVKVSYSDVPWTDIRGARNVLIHEYFGVSLPIIWDTILHSLPPLRVSLERMLDQNKP